MLSCDVDPRLREDDGSFEICDLEIVWKLEIENWKLFRLLLVMKILVDFSELLVGDVGVDLGGGD